MPGGGSTGFLGLAVSAALTILWALPGCRPAGSVTIEAGNVRHEWLHATPDVGLLVISDARNGQAWYRTERRWRIESLKNVPETSLGHVWQLAASPGDTYLAVLSEGEGHPMVDLFDLGEVLDTRDSDDDQAVKPLLIIDPYPGGVWIIRWRNDSVLEIRSDAPLDRLDKAERRVPAADPWDIDDKAYLWDVKTDTISRVRH